MLELEVDLLLHMPRDDAEKQISSSTELPAVPVYEDLPKLGDILPASPNKVGLIFSHNAEVQVVLFREMSSRKDQDLPWLLAISLIWTDDHVHLVQSKEETPLSYRKLFKSFVEQLKDIKVDVNIEVYSQPLLEW